MLTILLLSDDIICLVDPKIMTEWFNKPKIKIFFQTCNFFKTVSKFLKFKRSSYNIFMTRQHAKYLGDSFLVLKIQQLLYPCSKHVETKKNPLR